MGNRLRIEPCIPQGWQEYSLRVRYGRSCYIVRVTNPNGKSTGIKGVQVDGKRIEGNVIELVDDGQTHEVHAHM